MAWPSRRKVDLSSLKRGGKQAGGGGGRRVASDGRGGYTIATSNGGAGSRAPQQQKQQRETSSTHPQGVGAGGGRFQTTEAAAAVSAIPAVYSEAGSPVTGKKKRGTGGGAPGVRGKKGPAQYQHLQQKGRANGGAKTKGLSNGEAGSSRSLEELMSGGLAAVRR